jgi:hypothetical protein
MTKYHFITFATPDHLSFAQQNVNSAMEVGGFDTATIYNMDDIDEYYKTKNASFFKSKRSAYFLWKPYIIFKKLLEIDEGDILCYNDSKYIWQTNVRNMEDQLLQNKNIGVYKNKPNDKCYVEKQWTKGDAFLLMNIPNNDFGSYVKNTPQVWAGYILLRKAFHPVRFIGEWLTYCQDPRIVADIPSELVTNDNIFVENRHDQTVLSLLCKKWGIQMHTLDKHWMIDVRNPL